MKDCITKRKYVIIKGETEPDEYLAILPCSPCEDSVQERLIVDINGRDHSFELLVGKQQVGDKFGEHGAYGYLINNRCSPNCILEGWRLDKDGETRVLVKTPTEDSPFGGDRLSADFGNDAIPCMCSGCIEGNNDQSSTAEEILAAEAVAKTIAPIDETIAAEAAKKTIAPVKSASPPKPLKKRTLEGYINLILMRFLSNKFLLINF